MDKRTKEGDLFATVIGLYEKISIWEVTGLIVKHRKALIFVFLSIVIVLTYLVCSLPPKFKTEVVFLIEKSNIEDITFPGGMDKEMTKIQNEVLKDITKDFLASSDIRRRYFLQNGLYRSFKGGFYSGVNEGEASELFANSIHVYTNNERFYLYFISHIKDHELIQGWMNGLVLEAIEESTFKVISGFNKRTKEQASKLELEIEVLRKKAEAKAGFEIARLEQAKLIAEKAGIHKFQSDKEEFLWGTRILQEKIDALQSGAMNDQLVPELRHFIWEKDNLKLLPPMPGHSLFNKRLIKIGTSAYRREIATLFFVGLCLGIIIGFMAIFTIECFSWDCCRKFNRKEDYHC